MQHPEENRRPHHRCPEPGRPPTEELGQAGEQVAPEGDLLTQRGHDPPGDEVCSGQTITRGALRGLSAGWYTPFVGNTPYVETAFEQKVTAGRPSYTFSVEIPRYTYARDSAGIYRRTATTAWVTYKL
ncbi:hypothetical protein LJR047_003037 [Knoellia sp. LjRoot47]